MFYLFTMRPNTYISGHGARNANEKTNKFILSQKKNMSSPPSIREEKIGLFSWFVFVFSINFSGLQYIIKKPGVLDNLMQVIRGKSSRKKATEYILLVSCELKDVTKIHVV